MIVKYLKIAFAVIGAVGVVFGLNWTVIQLREQAVNSYLKEHPCIEAALRDSINTLRDSLSHLAELNKGQGRSQLLRTDPRVKPLQDSVSALEHLLTSKEPETVESDRFWCNCENGYTDDTITFQGGAIQLIVDCNSYEERDHRLRITTHFPISDPYDKARLSGYWQEGSEVDVNVESRRYILMVEYIVRQQGHCLWGNVLLKRPKS
jgi:hypothetical protein